MGLIESRCADCFFTSTTIVPGAAQVTLFAASSWPFVILLAAPVLVLLFLSAHAYAHNARQRIANQLCGFLGCMASMIFLRLITKTPGNEWLIEGDIRIIFVAISTSIGAVIGVAVPVCLRAVVSLLVGRIFHNQQVLTSERKEKDLPQNSEGENKGVGNRF